MNEMLVIAHRGASGTCPENTLMAFRKALEMGAKWLELDTQQVEERLVVFHDDSLERTTDGRGLLADAKLAELRQLNAGAGEKVPLLEEVLTLAAGRAQVNIELKGPGTGAAVAKLLTQMMTRHQLEAEDVLASSLLIEELREFQRRMPQVRCAPIYEVLPEDFGEQLKQFGAWSVHLHKLLITEEVVEQARRQKTHVFAWTVNNKVEAEELVKKGTAGIFTDHPEKFIIRNN